MTPLRASHLLLFWMLLRRVDAKTDACNPTSFLINGGDPFDAAASPISAATNTGAYCSNPYVPPNGGGPLNNWAWGGYLFRTCMFGGSEECACDTQTWNNVDCKCRSSYNTHTEMCYMSSAACPKKCDYDGQYVSGCGCVDCRDQSGDACTTTYDVEAEKDVETCDKDRQYDLKDNYNTRMQLYRNLDLFNFLEHKCTDNGFRTGYLCGPGKCRDCPKGYYCKDKRTALPCPAGTFQNTTGQTTCLTCSLATKLGACLPAGNTTENNCDPEKGWRTAPLDCGDCTPLPAGRSLISNNIKTCTCRGVVPGKIMVNGACKNCFKCSGKKFHRSTYHPYYCAGSEADCVSMYYDDTATAAYECHPDASAPDEADRWKNICTGMENEDKIKQGEMPWRASFSRTLPPDAWRQQPGNYEKGLVPYYESCQAPTSPYTWRTPALLPSIEQDRLNNLTWSELPRIDCQLTYAYQCVANHVADLLPASSLYEPTLLKACLKCGPHGTSPGGLTTQCVCDDGFGNWAQIERRLGQSVLGPSDLSRERACLDCSAGVIFRHATGEYYAEALACQATSPTPTIERCAGEWEYVKDNRCQFCPDYITGTTTSICPTSGPYQTHTPRRITTFNRTACALCPPGTFIDRVYDAQYKCSPCPTGHFQDASGQCGCHSKRTFCPMGQQLRLNTATEDLTSDAPCDNCSTECKYPQITVYQDYVHSQMGHTCSGKGQYYYGCFSDTTLSGLGPDTKAGHRLAFDPRYHVNDSPQGVSLEECDQSLLPNRSSFVTYHMSTMRGLECHFACLYGVNRQTAVAYNKAIQNYVATHPLLDRFLPSPATQSASPLAERIHVPMPWTPSKGGNAPGAWTVDETWTPASSRSGMQLHDNTFLFDHDFLKTQTDFESDKLCLTAEEAYTGRCPVGMRQTLPDPLPPCALLARTRSLVVTKDTQTAMAVLSSNADVVQCMNDPKQDYRGFRVGCERACLEEQRERAQALLASLSPDDTWYARIGWVFYLSSPYAWFNLYDGFQPYFFPYDADRRPPSSSSYVGTLNVTYIDTTAPFQAAVSNASDACTSRCARSSGNTYQTFRYDPAVAHKGDDPPPILSATLARMMGASLPVCVPCDYEHAGVSVSFGTSVCRQLFTPVRYFDNEICKTGLPNVTELTAEHVCSRCALTKPHATLIDSRATPGIWQLWEKARSNTYGTYTRDWNTNCRYLCGAGYGSNPSGASSYDDTPCVPCDTFTCQSDGGRAMYTSVTTPCGEPANYKPVDATCRACDTQTPRDANGDPIYLFQNNGSIIVSDATLCPAICAPDRYQTLYYNDKGIEVMATAGRYYPMGRLRCRACSNSDPNFPCADVCPRGRYRNYTTDECLVCNTSRCPEGQYRTLCASGVDPQDAQCMNRSADVLSNPISFSVTPAIPASDRAYSALEAARGRASRRWLTTAERNATPVRWIAAYDSPVPEQVALVCLNNWAWVDIRTGRSPWANFSGVLRLEASFLCVECTALHTDRGNTDRRLYSVWNASENSTVYATPVRGLNSVLDSLTSVWGGCYACDGVRDVEAQSSTLCELPPGHSADAASGCSLVEVTVPGMQSLQGGSALSIALIASGEENLVMLFDPVPRAHDGGGARRRHLLQLPSAVATLTPDDLLVARTSTVDAPPTMRMVLPARRTPLLEGGAYFSCCDTLSSVEDANACRALRGVHRDLYMRSDLVQMPCAGAASPPHRRLLQAPTDTRCGIGTFKPQRGDAQCAFCPSGATTAGVAATSVASCQCLPGYTLSGGVCAPCAEGTYRGAADAVCLPCPRRHVTQGLGATACVCAPGTFYSSFAAECLDCPPHHHCANGVLTPCPLHGVSRARSESVSNCTCDPRGFYGDLSQPTGVCYPLTPGLHPSGDCAFGWTRVVESGQVRCESRCPAGTYARVDSRSGALQECVTCPTDTYAVDGTLVDACTDCPTGRGTAGRTGQTSPDACRCLMGPTQAATCAGCGADLYFDPLDRVCQTCPAGWVAPPNSVGVGACQCPRGTYAFGSACAPCPIGTYSHAMGLTCTPCPKGCTTNAQGQTTYAACYCG